MFIAYIPVLILLISVSLKNRIVPKIYVRLNSKTNIFISECHELTITEKIAKPIADLGSFQCQVFNFTVIITANLHIVCFLR